MLTHIQFNFKFKQRIFLYFFIWKNNWSSPHSTRRYRDILVRCINHLLGIDHRSFKLLWRGEVVSFNISCSMGFCFDPQSRCGPLSLNSSCLCIMSWAFILSINSMWALTTLSIMGLDSSLRDDMPVYTKLEPKKNQSKENSPKSGWNLKEVKWTQKL